MRHRKHTFKIGPGASYRSALLMNLVNALLTHERIKTTITKAKEARRMADKMITLAKRNTLHTRRQALKKLRSKDVVGILFSKYAQRYADRNGGYTRIIRLQRRPSDSAQMVFLELVDRLGTESEKAKGKSKKTQKAAPGPEQSQLAAEKTAKPEAAIEQPEDVLETPVEEPSAAEIQEAEPSEQKLSTDEPPTEPEAEKPQHNPDEKPPQ